MTVYEYKGFNLTWLHQWTLFKMKENPNRLFTVSDLNRTWNIEQGYDMVNKSKLYRVFSRLREANLVHTHVEKQDNIADKKNYQLNDDGRYYVENMREKLARPPRLKLKIRVDNLEYDIEKLTESRDAHKFYLKQLLKQVDGDFESY